MKKFFKLLTNYWTLTLLGLIAFSVLIWFAGPLIAIGDYRLLESSTARLATITFIIIFIISRILWRFIKSRNLNIRFIDSLLQKSSSAQDLSNAAKAEEVTELQKRFEKAVSKLKKTNFSTNQSRSLLSLLNKQYIYELPWYIFIGAPGSGKTTALTHSGLQFPLTEQHEKKEITGVGGTRNCDWFFTNEAVLLDTAGRFVTQESHHEADSAEWLEFLKLLKQYRPRRPINGVIVTISLSDLLQQTAAQREQHANEIRKRVQELHTELNIRFPLYVLVTKMDLLGGFMEFFGEFGKEERSQVWGTTFPLSENQKDFQIPNFQTEFSALEQRLFDRLVDYVQQERDFQKRALLYSFPQQFSNLTKILNQFLNEIFSSSRFEQQPLLRGVYFTSGTQEGNPIDRVMANLARSLQLDRKLFFPNRPSGKSFFLTKLIKNVIFPEADLAGTNLRWERHQALLQWSTFATALLISISLIAAWIISFTQNEAYVNEVESKIPLITKQVAELPVSQNMNLLHLLAVLRSVQELPTIPGMDISSPSLSMGLGLYQGEKISAAANIAYEKLLQNALLPQIVMRIESLLNNAINTNNLEIMYEGLKAYLMLFQPDHFDSVALKAFILNDWQNILPREFTHEHRLALESHLDNLLSYGQLNSPIEINANLVKKIRERLSNKNLSERIYNRLMLQGVGSDIPEFTISSSVGPAALLVFKRTSGLPLTRGVPGLFSLEGYYKHFIPAVKAASAELTKEEVWVLDLPENQRALFLSPTDIEIKVREIYLREFIKRWEAFINDIEFIKANTLNDSIELTRLISTPDSVLPQLLQSIVKQITLIQEENDSDFVKEAAAKVKNAREKLEILLNPERERKKSINSISQLEDLVNNHKQFRALRELVQPPGPGQLAPIDKNIMQLHELFVELSAAEEAIKEKVALPTSKIFENIINGSVHLPAPLKSMFTTLTMDGRKYVISGSREALVEPLRNTITKFCNDALTGRYPFTKKSNQDVTQDDFARLFKPGGIFDDFFQKNLAQSVDTSSQSWRFRKTDEAKSSGISRHLEEFYRASVIRDVFFHDSNPTAKISIAFTPIDMDPTITQFTLDFDGQFVKYSHGPQVPITIQWPGPRGSSQVRIQVSPAASGSNKSGQTYNGPWALFRMFDDIQIIPSTQNEKFTAIFNIDGRKAQFEVTTNSVKNPFRLKELEQFKCPTKL
ncbi:MAG: type VI secretion system membrane subunit TssM [Nitrosomonas sp.]|nr:type VI secretion system membrane subunit TssM [Nitrosomonas sp.]